MCIRDRAYDLKRLPDFIRHQALREVELQQRVLHPSCVQLYGAFVVRPTWAWRGVAFLGVRGHRAVSLLSMPLCCCQAYRRL